jgi:anti-sigma-K factor RskA
VNGCDHVRTELGAYVLGALEPAEADSVREHLQRCSECAREHAAIAQLPALLTLAEPIESAPPLAPAVEERVLDAVALERGHHEPRRARRLPFRPRLIPVAAAAAFVAVVAVALVLALGRGGGGGGYQIAFHPVSGSAAGGHAQLESTAGGTRLQVWAKNLPRDPNAVYEVRCEARGWSASAGTFRADSQGHAYAVLTTAMRRGQYDSIRIVRRTRGSSTDVMTASLN